MAKSVKKFIRNPNKTFKREVWTGWDDNFMNDVGDGAKNVGDRVSHPRSNLPKGPDPYDPSKDPAVQREQEADEARRRARLAGRLMLMTSQGGNSKLGVSA